MNDFVVELPLSRQEDLMQSEPALLEALQCNVDKTKRIQLQANFSCFIVAITAVVLHAYKDSDNTTVTPDLLTRA